MAKVGGAQTLWLKASELNQFSKGSKTPPLELSCLKSFIPQGLERGSIVELCGQKSSGKTSTSLYILAESIRKGEICAYVDLRNQFDPEFFPKIDANLSQLSWIRCKGNIEYAIRATDLLLHAGGFGLVLLDLSGASPKDLNRIPLSYWFRFQRAIENTSTILLLCIEFSQARSCSSLSLQIQSKMFHWTGNPPFQLLDALETTMTPRKAAHSKITSIRPEYIRIETPRVETVSRLGLTPIQEAQ